jgi:hypothetical protein
LGETDACFGNDANQSSANPAKQIQSRQTYATDQAVGIPGKSLKNPALRASGGSGLIFAVPQERVCKQTTPTLRASAAVLTKQAISIQRQRWKHAHSGVPKAFFGRHACACEGRE